MDAFVDWPVAGGDAVTAQADYSHIDTDPNFAQSATSPLYAQHNWLFEGGYYFHGVRLEPFVQAASVQYADEIHPEDSRYRVGLAWWGNGHKFNLKLAGGKIRKEGEPDRKEVVLQMQVFAF